MAGIGATLRQAREAKGISLQEVQAEIRIREKYLLALEAEDFAEIPGDVYLRGFLRSYARFLGLDPQDLLRQVPPPAVVNPAPPLEQEEAPRPLRPIAPPNRGPARQWPWVFFPLVFLALLLYFVGSHGSLFGGVAPTAPTKTHHVHAGSGSTGKKGGSGGGTGSGGGATQIQLQPAAPSQGPFGGPETNYTVSKGPITIQIQLTGPCYVYVDVDGSPTPQAASVQTSGTLDFTAQQSVVIKIGNPPAATLQIDGQPVPLQGQNAQSVGVQVQGG